MPQRQHPAHTPSRELKIVPSEITRRDDERLVDHRTAFTLGAFLQHGPGVFQVLLVVDHQHAVAAQVIHQPRSAAHFQRGDDQPVNPLLAALRAGVEGADRIDLIAEQLDARWNRQARAPHIDDAAAPAERTDALDHRFALVADTHPVGEHRFQRQHLVLPQHARAALEARQRHRGVYQRARAGHDERGGRVRSPESRSPGRPGWPARRCAG